MAGLSPSLAPWLPSAGAWQQPELVSASSTNPAEPRPHGWHWDVQGGDLCPTQTGQCLAQGLPLGWGLPGWQP